MSKSVYLRRNETVNSMGDKTVLYYCVSENERMGLGKTYDILVEMYVQQPGNRSEKQQKRIERIFSDRASAEKLADILCDKCVLPSQAFDEVYSYNGRNDAI